MSRLNLVAVLYAKPGQETLLRAKLSELVEPPRKKEDGPLRYELLLDEENPRRFVLAERREDDRTRIVGDAEGGQVLAFEAMHWDWVEKVEGYRLGRTA
jgi:hypothetical protein